MKIIAIIAGVLVFNYWYVNDYVMYSAKGKSMTPYFQEGGMRKVYIHKNPINGDSIVFKCLVDKCNKKTLHKFLKEKKDNCIWVEGGNEKSLDSRKYGWLCGKEYKIIGVVK